MTGQWGPEVDDDEDEIVIDGLANIDDKFCVPDGLWELKIIDAKKATSKSSGAPMIVLTVATTGVWSVDKVMQDHPDGEAHGGKEFKSYISLSASALFKTKQLAEALDLPFEEDDNGQPRLRLKISSLIGKQLLAVMTEEEWEGRKRSSVGNFHRHPDGPE